MMAFWTCHRRGFGLNRSRDSLSLNLQADAKQPVARETKRESTKPNPFLCSSAPMFLNSTSHQVEMTDVSRIAH